MEHFIFYKQLPSTVKAPKAFKAFKQKKVKLFLACITNELVLIKVFITRQQIFQRVFQRVFQARSLFLYMSKNVPSILDSVGRSSRQQLSNERPLVAHGLLSFQQDQVFLLCESKLVDAGIQAVAVPLAALLAAAALEM